MAVPNEPDQAATDEVTSYASKNGLVWLSAQPPTSRTRACNIRHTREGPSSGAKEVESEMDVFMCFMDNEILYMVIENTNKYGRMYMGGES